MKSKVNPIDSYRQFMSGKGVQDAPPNENSEGEIPQSSVPSVPLSQVTMLPQVKEEPAEVDLPDDEEMMLTGAISPTKVEAQDDEPPTDRPLLADP